MSRAQSLQLLLLDLLLAGAALVAAEALLGDTARPDIGPGRWAAPALVLIAWLVALRLHGPYLREALGSHLLLVLRAAWGLGLASAVAAGLAHLLSLPGQPTVGQYLLALALMLLGVVVTRIALARGPWWAVVAPNIVLAGNPDDRSRQLVAEMEAERRCRVTPCPDGERAALADALRRDRVTHLLLLKDPGPDAPALAEAARAAGVEVISLDHFYMDLMERAPLVHENDTCEEDLLEPTVTPLGRALHRANDLVMCLLLAPLALTLTALAALAVKLTSPGPVFFSQHRAGKDERPFILYKVRTMTHDAPNDFAHTTENDPRIIPVGGILRRLRIDELPQLLCVLTGSMSLIGPRPEMDWRHEELKGLVKLFHWRTRALPGITGWAQVNLGYCGDDEEALEKLRYDLYYVHRQSPLLDLRIMLRTPITILLGHGVR